MNTKALIRTDDAGFALGIDDMLDALEENSAELTDWEATFVDEIQVERANGHITTFGQRQKVVEIWDRVVGE